MNVRNLIASIVIGGVLGWATGYIAYKLSAIPPSASTFVPIAPAAPVQVTRAQIMRI
ncbi:MAG: hypothetical protein J2P54_15925 [Bradyrhizobiaceae bacterium]|nr:hypothetical protein [Bradyrhizobiaceae bacterium]